MQEIIIRETILFTCRRTNLDMLNDNLKLKFQKKYMYDLIETFDVLVSLEL